MSSNKIINIIKKNYKLIFRSKSSALTVILGPLLIIILVGLAFSNSSAYVIKVGVFSESYSDLSNSVLNIIKQNKYEVIQVASKEECIAGIEVGKFNTCMILPKNLNSEEGGKISFYIDNSRANLAYVVIDTITSSIGAKSQELSLQTTTKILNVLEDANKQITDKILIVESIESSAESSNDELIRRQNDINKLDFAYDYSTLDVSLAQGELSKIEAENNKTYSVLGRVLRELKTSIDNALTKLDAAQTMQSRTLTSLDTLKSSVGSMSAYAATLYEDLTLVSTNIKSLNVKSAEKVVAPLTTEVEEVVSEKGFLNYLFPTLLVLVVMFVSILLSSTLIIREKTSSAHFRNSLTPTSQTTFLISSFLTNISIVFIQTLIILGVALFFLKNQLLINIHLAILAMLLISAVFITLGMLIGYIFNSEETGTLAAITTSSIFLLFSNTILPLETLPSFFNEIAKYNPFVLAETILNKIILFNSSITVVLTHILLLLAYSLILFFFVYAVKILSRERI